MSSSTIWTASAPTYTDLTYYAGIERNGVQTLTLSDGSTVVGIIEANATASSTTLKLYHSSDRSSWSNKLTFNPTTSSGQQWNNVYYDFAWTIDSSNNIHMIYDCINGGTYYVYYVKFTYGAGPTWSAGSSTQIDTHSYQCFDLCIESINGDTLLAGWHRDTGSAMNTYIRCKTSGGSWGTTQQLNTATGSNRYQCGLRFASDAAGIVSNTIRVMFMDGTDNYAAVDLYNILLNTSTGAFSGQTNVSGDFIGGRRGTEWRGWGTIMSTASGKWRYVTATIYISNNKVYLQNWAGEVSTSAHTIPSTSSGSQQWYSINDNANPVASYFNGKGVVWWTNYSSSKYKLYSKTCEFTASAVNWSPLSTNVNNTNMRTKLFAPCFRNNGSSTYAEVTYYIRTNHTMVNYVFTATELATPTSPGSGSTIIVDDPTLTGYLTNVALGGVTDPRGVEWQLATDTGFSSNVRNVLLPLNNFSSTIASRSTSMPVADYLFQSTWYIRARALDMFGREGSWSSYYSFSVAHLAFATGMTPTSESFIDWGSVGDTSFAWVFNDPASGDAQTAYRIIVERNSDDYVIQDTGKVVSTVKTAVITIGSGYKDTLLRWRIALWDSDDVQGNFSDNNLFYVGSAPSISVYDGESDPLTIDTPSPLVTWVYTSGGGGRVQSQYRVEILDSTYAQIYDSGWIVSADESHQILQSDMATGNSYTVQVSVKDDVNLESSDTHGLTASWTPPTSVSGVSVDTSDYPESGYTTISWNNTGIDTDFYAWRVYRRVNGTTDASMILETAIDTVLTFDDWFPESGETYDFGVTQVAIRFGALVESATSWVNSVTATSDYYWLLHPEDSTKNIRLYSVISDTFSEEYEMETLNLIGRGRKTDYGERYGYIGTLVCHLRGNATYTAREMKQQLELMKSELRELYLRNPFGDTWQVALGDLQTGRVAGVGNYEYVDVTIPYQEVM